MVDRRRVLQVAAVGAVGLAVPACRSSASDDDAEPPPADQQPDEQQADELAEQQADELALIAAYDAALADTASPARATLQRLRDEHAAHLRALGWDEQTPTQTPVKPPARRQLVRAERRALRLRTAGAQRTDDPEQAQLLTLIAASEAQHIATLESL